MGCWPGLLGGLGSLEVAELRLFKAYKALQAQFRAIIKAQDTRRGPMIKPLKCQSLGSSVSLLA